MEGQVRGSRSEVTGCEKQELLVEVENRAGSVLSHWSITEWARRCPRKCGWWKRWRRRTMIARHT